MGSMAQPEMAHNESSQAPPPVTWDAVDKATTGLPVRFKRPLTFGGKMLDLAPLGGRLIGWSEWAETIRFVA